MRSSIAILPVLAAIVGSQTIDPASVPLNIRSSWCTSQIASCPLLCLQNSSSSSTRLNTCDPKTLTFSCVCLNGISPNASEYSQTVPYYICTEAANQCVTACGLANNECSSNCRTAHPCGAQDPTRVNSSTISSTTSAGSSGTGAAGSATTTGFGAFGGAGGTTATATSTSAAKSAAIAALNLGNTYGLVVIAGGMFAGFAMML